MHSTTIANLEVLPPEAAPMHPAPVAEITAINRYHNAAISAADEARTKAEEASHFALLAGTLLEDLRNSTPHGGWEGLFSHSDLTPNRNQIGKWFGFEFSSRTALKYIEVAKRIRLTQSMTTKAQKHLSAIASAPHIDEDAREFLNKLTKGQTLRQLYLDLDIITAPAPKEKPEKEKPDKPKLLKSTAQIKLEDARVWLDGWKNSFEIQLKSGGVDDLDRPGLLDLQEFLLTVRDRVNKRLK